MIEIEYCIRYYSTKNQAKNNICVRDVFNVNDAFAKLKAYKDYNCPIYGDVKYAVEEFKID